MRTFLSILVLTFVLASGARTTSADDLIGWSVLVESNLQSFDPVAFRPSVFFDVYHIVVHNPNVGGVTSLELDFSGHFLNEGSHALSFRPDSDLPRLGPNVIAESFFVLPDIFSVSDVLAIGTIDHREVLSSSYILPRGSLLDGGSTATVAVLSVNAGYDAPDVTRFSGRAAIDGAFHDIRFPVPEPTTAFLALLGVASLALRRHR